MKHQYPIYEVKAKLSEVLRRVRENGSIVITDHGVPVAEVVPFARETSLERRLAMLEERGLASLAQAGALEPLARSAGALTRFLKDRE